MVVCAWGWWGGGGGGLGTFAQSDTPPIANTRAPRKPMKSTITEVAVESSSSERAVATNATGRQILLPQRSAATPRNGEANAPTSPPAE